MRPLCLLACPLAVMLSATAARADDAPDPTAAFLAGATTSFAAILAGSTIMAVGNRNVTSDNVGWLTMLGGFIATPVVAHGVEGEWLRGLAYATVPAAMTVGTGALFAVVPGTVDSGTLWEQRLMWSLYGIAFAGAAVGVVDATLAPRRARARAHEAVVAPLLGPGCAGLQIVGAL